LGEMVDVIGFEISLIVLIFFIALW